nr:ATP-binding protein [Burkholderia gladioli]
MTHLDALWRVADQIAGPKYPINPAEAFVLGGAILLHDAAHVLAAYPDGFSSIKETIEWKDLIAQKYGGKEPIKGTPDATDATFQVLRHLHADQAHRLASIHWAIPESEETMFLLEDLELRTFYGDLIGEIASSHHWPSHRVATSFADRVVSPPSFLPTEWEVDAMKIAFLLRTADAAHLDDKRAPWFLFALKQPTGISAQHWRFQAKMGQPTRTANGQLRLTAGAPFTANERRAWWLAYDTACMIDRELRDASVLLREGGRPAFAAGGVEGVESPTAFARYVRVRDWEPVDLAPKVGDVPRLIKSLGGEALYGDHPFVSLREILQNGMDAVRSLRSLELLGEADGHISVSLEQSEDSDWWLHVTDTGIGMSRFVLTNILLDFGNSLWRSDALREELPGLAKSGFDAAGKFGIGFYSVFMLGENVRVTSRRFEQSQLDTADQWTLTFDSGLAGRPMLAKARAQERLQTHGTRVSVKLKPQVIRKLLSPKIDKNKFNEIFETNLNNKSEPNEITANELQSAISRLVAWICPGSDIELRVHVTGCNRAISVRPGDWRNLTQQELAARVKCSSGDLFSLEDESGRLLGRVGVAESIYSSMPGAVMHHGLRSGAMDGLIGLCMAQGNNSDAKRAEAKVAGSSRDWSNWAEKVIAGTSSNQQSLYVRIHPLLPDRDFPIWQIGDQVMTLEKLCDLVRDWDKVMVHDGEIRHDDDDNVAGRRFAYSFRPFPNILCCPSHAPYKSIFLRDDHGYSDFAWFLGAEPIEYMQRLVDGLRSCWGDINEESEVEVVGKVGGSEIVRLVTIISKIT